MNNALRKLTLLVCMLLGVAHASIKLMTDVPSPQHVVGGVPIDSESAQIYNILSKVTLEEYYKVLNDKLYVFPISNKSEWENRELVDLLWLCYYASSGPFYVIDYDTEKKTSNKFTGDYDARCDVVYKMSMCVRWLNDVERKKKVKVNKTGVNELCVVYMVRIMKDLRDQYDPSIEVKNKEWFDSYKKIEVEKFGKWLDAEKKRRGVAIYSGPVPWDAGETAVMYVNKRNDKAKYVREFIEQDFVNTLISAYPKNATAVKRSIREAGYTEEEVDDLIDRTVGRTAETEYLYKGRKEDKPPKKSKDKDHS